MLCYYQNKKMLGIAQPFGLATPTFALEWFTFLFLRKNQALAGEDGKGGIRQVFIHKKRKNNM